MVLCYEKPTFLLVILGQYEGWTQLTFHRSNHGFRVAMPKSKLRVANVKGNLNL